jgi:FkbM family methyltransferase
MKSKFNDNKNVYLNNVAVGSKTEIKIFNQIKGGGRSSFLTSTVDDLSKQEQIDVQVETVDAYVKKNNIKKINLLKIDVQGFEDEVLKGAQETLKLNKIDIIETELILGNMYEKTLSFNEIENLIYPYGYKFFALTCTNIETYSLNLWKLPELQFDVIYTSNDIYNDYVKGRNFFEKSHYRRGRKQTVEEFMNDKLIRK